jgi:hypothetical protein
MGEPLPHTRDPQNYEAVEIYKAVLNSINSNESKRVQSNATYTGFSAALFGISSSGAPVNATALLCLCLIVSIIWYFTIKFHRDLSHAKWKVCSEIENDLMHQPFQAEWRIMKARKRAFGLTQIEFFVPAISGSVSLLGIMYLNIGAILKFVSTSHCS